MAVNRALSQAQASQFKAALESLQAGKPDKAVAIARQLAAEMPDAADAQQLLGMTLADTGASDAAEAAFRRALALAPGSQVVVLNFSAWLRKLGRLREAADLLGGASESGQTKTQQGLVALQMQDYPQALQAFRHAIRLQPEAVLAWHGMGNALRATADIESAEAAFRKATDLSPTYAPAWANLGVVLRLLGRMEEAMSCVKQAEILGYSSAEFSDTINGILADAGRPAEALNGARKLVREHPDFAQGYDTLTRLLWEHGPELAPDENPLSVFRSAVQSQPCNRRLWLKYVRILLSARKADEALALVQMMRQREQDDPVLDWLAADTFDALGQRDAAAVLYAKTHRVIGDVSPDFLNAYARHAFRAGRFDQAQSCAAAAVCIDPVNQEAWSHLGTAWRLVGDSREDWLCDYERLIGFVEVAPPGGGEDMTGFLDALTTTLDTLHSAGREPVDQSVRNGSQTSGRLFGRSDRVIAGAESALRAAVENWLSTLPEDPKHPFLAQKRRSVRMSGSWSVKLRASGRHSNHIHPEGWMSSAFYVSLPAAVRDSSADTHAGWIQFGQPLEELGLGLPPRRLIRPKPGYLALFPSYMWHGTVPFSSPEARLTIAFDMRPAD